MSLLELGRTTRRQRSEKRSETTKKYRLTKKGNVEACAQRLPFGWNFYVTKRDYGPAKVGKDAIPAK